MNFDETPVPFEFLDGSSYDVRGNHTVAGKTDRSGWSKRQATIILYLFADGQWRLKPKLIFKATSNDETRRITRAEIEAYHPDVTVEYNETAYNNEFLMHKWIDQEVAPLFKGEPALIVMDSAGFHKTPAILAKLDRLGISRAVIPGSLTPLIQPCDTHLNRSLKGFLFNIYDDYLAKQKALGDFEK